jgi:hypothetical protein
MSETVNEALKYPDWQLDYLAAITEVDETMLLVKVKIAQEAIRRRLEELEASSNHEDECMALNDAARILRFLVK